LRHAHPCLRTGDYKVLFSEGELYVFARILEQEELIIAVNVGTASVKADIDTSNLRSQPNKLLYANDKVELNNKGDSLISLNIPARTGCILN